MPKQADEDRSLVDRAKNGDFEAFESLVAKYQKRLFAVARRIVGNPHDAEEVVQQTFLSVIENIAGFREEAKFYTWLMRIGTNHALALLRKRAVRATVPLADDRSDDTFADVPRPQYIAQWTETPDELASRAETRKLLSEAMDELDDKYRLVFLLRDVQGLSTAETAEALGISVSNVKVRLLRARLMLRERLTRVFGDEATKVMPGHDHG